MRKSEYNRNVLDNFILWYTHVNRGEPGEAAPSGNLPDSMAKMLYDEVDAYIEADHVDGVDGDGEPLNIPAH